MNKNDIEKLRKNISIKYLLIIISVILLLSTLLVIIFTDYNKKVLLIICALFVIIIAIILLSMRNEYPMYVNGFKKIYVLNALKKKFTNLYYDSKGMPSSVIWATHMLDMGDIYTSNDLISGKYKKANFMQADVRIQKVETYVDSEGNIRESIRDYFYGKWLVFDFNKKFKYNVQVREKEFNHALVSNDRSKYGYKEVKMEDEKFNQAFKIYTENEHDAFYILTPQMQQRILKIRSMVKGDLLLCFINNELHIGLNNRNDSFEPKIFKEEYEIDEYINKDIAVITNFIDELDLDNDLFRKEV